MFYFFKKLVKKGSLYFSKVNFFFLLNMFRNWVYKDVYKVLERYFFIFFFNKYKKSVQKKPKKMSVLYFYWLEYNILVYVGFLVFFFYIVYIFQFELIFYYFPDVFILRLNDLMSEPQLNFSGTNSFIVDSYISPQLEKKQLNISSLIGGSSYLFFKYRRFVRGIHYIQSHETTKPFWSEYPYSFRYWDPKRHRMPGDKSQTYHASIKDKFAHIPAYFSTIWYRAYMEFPQTLFYEEGTKFKSPYFYHERAHIAMFDWKYLRAKYKDKKKNNSSILASVPLLKANSTPFFYLHMYNLTEQKKYKQKVLYKTFLAKLSSSDISFKLPYNIDGQNLIRLVAHHQQLITKNEKRNFYNFFSNAIINLNENPVNPSKEYNIFNIEFRAFLSYVKNNYGIYSILDKIISKFNVYERPKGWLQELHLNNVMYTHLEKYMYHDITHYSYNKWRRRANLNKRRIGSNYRPGQKYVVKPAEFIRDSLYLPYVRKNYISRVDENFFFTNSEKLNFKYSKNLTGWFKRYANRLYETQYKTRVSPYRFLTRMDLEKKGVFFSEDKKYKMFLNYNLHQEPSGIGTSKQGFNFRNYPHDGKTDLEYFRLNANEGRKRFRNAFFLDDEFLLINNFRPARYFKIKQFSYDNFQAFINYAMVLKHAVDSPSRESFWKRFFSRYNYKKKDYYLYYGKRLYDFDKYKVDFSRRYVDIVFLLPERLFSFISSIFYHLKRREVFFLAKPYGVKKKVDQVEVHDYIVTNTKKVVLNILGCFSNYLNVFIKKIFSFIYKILVIFINLIYNFFYSFFHLSFILTKFLEFVKKGLELLLKKLKMLGIGKYLGIDAVLVVLNTGFEQKIKKINFFNQEKIYNFFEKSFFYKIYLKIWAYFMDWLNLYYGYIVKIINNNTYMISVLGQFQNLKKVLFSAIEYIQIWLIFSVKFSFSVIYKIGGVVFNLLYPIIKKIFIFFIEYIINILSKIIYMIPGLRRKRAVQLKVYVRSFLNGDYKLSIFNLKTYLLGFFPLNVRHFKAKLRVYLEEKNLKRLRYKTLMVKNRKNSYIWTPKRRILTSQLVFWIFVYVFFYIWICHLKLRLYLEEVQNVETLLLYVTPFLLVILGYLFSIVSGPVLDINIIHNYYDFYGFIAYIFDSNTGGRNNV